MAGKRKAKKVAAKAKTVAAMRRRGMTKAAAAKMGAHAARKC